MNEKNSDAVEKIPSGCPSPARVEKTDSSSSRQSGSPPPWDIECCAISDHVNREARIRPSSWDDSDDDLSPESERSIKTSGPYSSEYIQFRGSVAAEINEIKKQFFETLAKVRQENDNWDLESLKEKVETKLNSDRRQSPARTRRRTKSSSSSSPILESKNHSSPENPEKPGHPEAMLEISSKILEFDPKFYLNSFFTELRSRRISLTDSSPEIPNMQEIPDCEVYCREVKSPSANENDEHFCKTSRKLSQILEVEENKTDLEKSSEEKIENSEFISKPFKKADKNKFSPLQTAKKSKKIEKTAENVEEARNEEEKFKSLSYEEFGNFRKISKPFLGSLSERSGKIFDHKTSDNIISLCPKSAKTQLNSPESQIDTNIKNQVHLTPPASSRKGTRDFTVEPSSEDIEKSFDSRNYLQIDLMNTFKSENSTPRKSTERTERSHTNKNSSPNFKRNCHLESPKFTINIGRDSARSLRIDDVNTPDSLAKNSETGVSSEMKMPSLEFFKKSSKTARTSEHSFDLKTERNMRISPESLSQKSVKSSFHSSKELEANYLNSHKSPQRSFRKNENQRNAIRSRESETTEQNLTSLREKTESCSSVESSRSYENPFNISNRSGSSTKISYLDEQESLKNITRPNSHSSRSSKSNKTRSSKTVEDRFIDQLSDQESSRSNKIPELSLPLEISGGAESQKRYWSKKAGLKDLTKSRERSETNIETNPRLRDSERSLSSRSKNSESRRSTPHSLKAASKSSSSGSSRSKDNLENQNDVEKSENIRIADWKELENVYDTVDSHTPISSTGRRNIWRESDTQSQQYFDQTELLDSILTSKNSELSEEILLRSRKNSGRSVDSKISDRLENTSPTKSTRVKSRPNSGILEECKTTDINANVEKEKLEGNLFDKFTFEEDEDSEKNHSTRRTQSEVDPDRLSSKRLSIINEVSFEDLEVSTENEEKNLWKHSRPQSRRDRRQIFPQKIHKISENTPQSLTRNLNENPMDESTFDNNGPDDNRWNELIEKFYEVYEEPLLEKVLKEKDIRPLQNSQNLHYFKMTTEGPFEIGEFGDITCYNACQSNTEDSEKPRDHGDGIHTQKTSEMFVKTEKREKELKTQRHLWTELRAFQDSNVLLKSLSLELEDDINLKDFIPLGVKKSKSDNFIKIKTTTENECKNPIPCEFLSEFDRTPENIQKKLHEFEICKKGKKNIESLSKSIVGLQSSSESLVAERYSENEEFECEITPRLSRSLTNLKTQIENENLTKRRSEDTFTTSGIPCFQKSSSSEEKEYTDLNIFLASKEKKEKMAIKSNNWLNFKNPERKKSRKQDQKPKRKRKNSASSKYSFHEYLCSRKSRPNVPHLKLRNSNCFQSFYKRFISVFCLTSHSSATTSK